jgi:hypothetical protein
MRLYGCTAALLLLAVVASVGAVPPSGSPNIYYNQDIVIWSDAWNSYCDLAWSNTGQVGPKCDVGSTDIAMADRFAIGGGCGPVASNDEVNAYLYYNGEQDTKMWCYSVSATRYVYCDILTENPSYLQWGFSNIVQQSDGMLHGNATAVRISNTIQGVSRWCAANPASQDDGLVQCSRTSVSTWETLYFVPVE